MNSRKRSGSGIFLMEMIMVCGFFLLCAAVCIRVFVRSDAMSRLAREKNQAVLAAESLAETWKVKGMAGLGEGSPEKLTSAGGETHDVLFFDRDWKVLDETGSGEKNLAEEAFFIAELTLGKDVSFDGMEYLNLVFRRGGAHPYCQEKDKDGQLLTLYSLQVKQWIRQGGDSDGKE